jgi:hypothetical protein
LCVERERGFGVEVADRRDDTGVDVAEVVKVAELA